MNPPEEEHSAALRAAAESLVAAARRDPAVRGVYATGSFARNDADAFSDLDLYVVVHEGEFFSFLQRRIEFLQHYRSIRHYAPLFGGESLAVIFDNFVRVDLHTVTVRNATMVEAVVVLLDPDGLLQGRTATAAALTPTTARIYVDTFALVMHEIEAAHRRGDFVHAASLASRLVQYSAKLCRAVQEPHRAELGAKKLGLLLDAELLQRLTAALEELRPSTLLSGVCHLADVTREAAFRLPGELAADLNWSFYDEMHQRLRKLA